MAALIISILGSLIAGFIFIAVKSEKFRNYLSRPFRKYFKIRPAAELERFHKKHVEYIMRIYKALEAACPYSVIQVFEENEIISHRIQTKREHFAIATCYSEGEPITAINVRQLLRYSYQHDMRAMLITNASFSSEARKEVDIYNAKYPLCSLIFIKDDDKDALVEKLKPYFCKD